MYMEAKNCMPFPGHTMLQTEDVANAVIYALSTPPHVQVSVILETLRSFTLISSFSLSENLEKCLDDAINILVYSKLFSCNGRNIDTKLSNKMIC